MHMVCNAMRGRGHDEGRTTMLRNCCRCSYVINKCVCMCVYVRVSEQAAVYTPQATGELDRDRAKVSAHESEQEFQKRAPCVVCLLLLFS